MAEVYWLGRLTYFLLNGHDIKSNGEGQIDKVRRKAKKDETGKGRDGEMV